MEKTEAKLRAVLGDVVYGSNEDRLEQVIGNLLASRGDTIATAESCTGGYVAHLLTSIAGSSRYFMGSVVAYDNTVKIKQLGVDKDALDQFGAVSKEVVTQMAEVVRQKLETTWALATSGIAGPDGGTETKPVGTVWIALAGPTGTIARKYQFGKDRERNIKKSAFTALDLLRNALISKID
jgi:nicotinamide-nucleotide amidase